MTIIIHFYHNYLFNTSPQNSWKLFETHQHTGFVIWTFTHRYLVNIYTNPPSPYSILVRNIIFFFQKTSVGLLDFLPQTGPIWRSVALQGRISDIELPENKSYILFPPIISRSSGTEFFHTLYLWPKKIKTSSEFTKSKEVIYLSDARNQTGNRCWAPMTLIMMYKYIILLLPHLT
jgi:hypothetical protein